VKKFTASSGVFSKGVTVSYEYVITLQNGLDREIDLTIRDPFPISRDAQIKITRELPRSEEVKMTEEGIIIWQLKLKSHEHKTLSIKFTVEYPQGVEVTGLE